MGNLATPPSVQKLQTALHAKAKENPSFRFYALYDKLYRTDVLQYAYACCKANQGAPGLDGKRFEDIEAYGLERWLGELAQELKEEKYEPEAIRRVYIPKPNGKLRPLGIGIDANGASAHWRDRADTLRRRRDCRRVMAMPPGCS